LKTFDQVNALALRKDGEVLPWVSLVVREDMLKLYEFVPETSTVLPRPETDPGAWYKFMLHNVHKWEGLIGSDSTNVLLRDCPR